MAKSSKICKLFYRASKGQSWQEWLGEFLRFCVVGSVAYVVDVGLYNLLRFGPGQLMKSRYLSAAVISTAVAIVVSWILNRNWSFRSSFSQSSSISLPPSSSYPQSQVLSLPKRSQRSRRQEFAWFLLINLGGMLIQLLCLWISHALLGFHTPLADNVAKNVIGLALGMAFRYFFLSIFCV